MQNGKIAQVITKALQDENFKQQLKKDSAKTLAEQGVKLAPGVEVRIVENTDKVRYLVIPNAKAAVAAAGSCGGGNCG